jgi:hypothetical protein
MSPDPLKEGEDGLHFRTIGGGGTRPTPKGKHQPKLSSLFDTPARARSFSTAVADKKAK